MQINVVPNLCRSILIFIDLALDLIEYRFKDVCVLVLELLWVFNQYLSMFLDILGAGKANDS